MYDGTIGVLYQKPVLNGDAYYTHKANYGLNAEVNTLLNIFLCTWQTLFYKLAMHCQVFKLLTTHMAILVQHMTLLRLIVQVLPSIQIGF